MYAGGRPRRMPIAKLICDKLYDRQMRRTLLRYTGATSNRITRAHEGAKSHLRLLVSGHWWINRRCRCNNSSRRGAWTPKKQGGGRALNLLASLLLLVSVATAQAQHNLQLKDAADDVRAARALPSYTPPPGAPCNLNSRACKPKNALELSRACGQLSVVASLTSVVNHGSIERCRNLAFGPGDRALNVTSTRGAPWALSSF
jgi:hypothetical protein